MTLLYECVPKGVQWFILLTGDGGYTAWTTWSQCSVSCGDGRRSRTRSCTNPPPSPGGNNCSQLGPEKETEKCNIEVCPGKIIRRRWAKHPKQTLQRITTKTQTGTIVLLFINKMITRMQVCT